MTRTGVWTTFAGWGVAVALSAFACSNSDTKTNNKSPAGDATKAGEPAPAAATGGAAGSTAANEKSPVTLAGCLQKGDGRSDYLLTEVNTTRTTVGTSGSTPPGSSSPDVVGKEQMRSAMRTYKLSGERDTLEPLVGKEVRVSGTLAAPSDLTKDKDVDRTKIDQGDLAKVDVTTADKVSENCGSASDKK